MATSPPLAAAAPVCLPRTFLVKTGGWNPGIRTGVLAENWASWIATTSAWTDGSQLWSSETLVRIPSAFQPMMWRRLCFTRLRRWRRFLALLRPCPLRGPRSSPPPSVLPERVRGRTSPSASFEVTRREMSLSFVKLLARGAPRHQGETFGIVMLSALTILLLITSYY